MKRNFTYLKPKSKEEIDATFVDVPTVPLQLMLFNMNNNNYYRLNKLKLKKLMRDELLKRKEKMMAYNCLGDLILRKIPIRSRSTNLNVPKLRQHIDTDYYKNYENILRMQQEIKQHEIKQAEEMLYEEKIAREIAKYLENTIFSLKLQ